jgi:thiamine-monophosphate kinase
MASMTATGAKAPGATPPAGTGPGSGATLAETGESALVEAILRRLPSGAEVLLGPGDDAAVVAVPDGRVVATTDLLVEGVHFRRDWSQAPDVGHKAAAQNLADIAAMGARATALLVGLAAPASLPTAWVLGLADGLAAEAARAGAAVVGGDVVSGDRVVVSVMALGSLDGREAVTRAGARPGDVVAIAGRLGWSAAGLAVLTRGFRSPRALVAAHRRPEPVYAAGPQAALAGATSMVDVSDGLLGDLAHVAEASGVAISLDLAAIDVPAPVRDAAAALGKDPWEWVLTGGEDHALAATFPHERAVPDGWFVVGEVLAWAGGAGEPAGPAQHRVTVAGLPAGTYQGPGGWRHFSA